MTPINFPEANHAHGAPADMDESQVKTIPSFVGKVIGGNLDGAIITVVAWQPTPEDIAAINNGAPIFLSVMGGLPPHYLETNFKDAVGL